MQSDLINLDFDRRSGIATVRFNRPEAMNALNVKMAKEFFDVINELHRTPDLRCVVLRGNSRAFVAGGDVASMRGGELKAAASISSLLDYLNPALILLRAIDAPIVAGVQGVAAGAGLSVALMADLLVSDVKASFLIAYDGIGAVPDCGASWSLLYRLGPTKASELMLTGEKLSASDAERYGLVNFVAETADFESVLFKTVKRVANGPTKAYAAFRHLLEAASGVSLSDHLERERNAFLSITKTHDFHEGVEAFLDKRRADFLGK